MILRRPIAALLAVVVVLGLAAAPAFAADDKPKDKDTFSAEEILAKA
jgi:hypothetical protein